MQTPMIHKTPQIHKPSFLQANSYDTQNLSLRNLYAFSPVHLFHARLFLKASQDQRVELFHCFSLHIYVKLKASQRQGFGGIQLQTEAEDH